MGTKTDKELISFLCGKSGSKHSKKNVCRMQLYCSILSIAFGVFCFTGRELYYKACGAVLICSAFLGIIFTFIMTRHWTLIRYMLTTGVFALEAMICLGSIVLMLCFDNKADVYLTALLVSIPFAVSILYIGFYMYITRKGSCIFYRKVQKGSAVYGIAGASLGLVIAKIVFGNISYELAMQAATAIFTVLSSLAGLKAANLYKVKKLKDMNYDLNLD